MRLPGGARQRRLRDRFDEPVSPAMERFGSSLDVDLDMAAEDIAVSEAHARMLGEVGILAADEVEKILGGLARVGAELAADSSLATELADALADRYAFPPGSRGRGAVDGRLRGGRAPHVSRWYQLG